jgi:hypothetical protein
MAAFVVTDKHFPGMYGYHIIDEAASSEDAIEQYVRTGKEPLLYEALRASLQAFSFEEQQVILSDHALTPEHYRGRVLVMEAGEQGRKSIAVRRSPPEENLPPFPAPAASAIRSNGPS